MTELPILNFGHLNQTSIKEYLNLSLNFTKDSILNVSSYQHNSSLGVITASHDWEALSLILVLVTVILGTIFGNVLVIFGVFTHKPLRIVQNFFIVSLAAADLTVAVLVMPLNVAYATLDRWMWGKLLCKMWLTCDILCCTSSILNLCAIALDRYWAITDPINYANKRTMKRVVAQIVAVWILSLIISSPPLLGWNDWPEEFTAATHCQLTSEPGYVVYSALGSFFIPLGIMTMVYIKIYLAAKERLRNRRAAYLYKKRPERNLPNETAQENREESEIEIGIESDSGESIRQSQRKAFLDMKKNLFIPFILIDPNAHQTVNAELNVNIDAKPTYESNEKKTVGSIRILSQRRKKPEKALVVNVSSNGDAIHQFIEQKQKISLSKERRAARTLGVVMGVFVICWLPFFLMYVILPICPKCNHNKKLINIITWLGYLNSTANPIIYTIYNLDFRKAFKKLLGLT